MDIGAILSCADLAKSVACYLKLCESIDSKVSRLINCDLGAGIQAVNHAINANNNQAFYIKEAWHSFNRATNLEKDERLVLAYIGLAMCNIYMLENGNAKQNLSDALKVKNSGNKFIANHTKVSDLASSPILGFAGMYYKMQYYKREARICSLKNDIKEYINSI